MQVKILYSVYQFLMFFVIRRQSLFFAYFLSSELGKVVWMMFDSLTAMKDAAWVLILITWIATQFDCTFRNYRDEVL